MPGKLGVTSTQRKTMLRNLASDLLRYGKLETTLARAKELRPYVEKIITLAVNNYTDVVATEVTVKDEKGKETTKKIIKDGPNKLAARRRIMALTHDVPALREEGEKMSDYKKRTAKIKHALMDEIFTKIAPAFAERAEKLGQGGGYTRIYQLNNRRGDDAEMAIIELILD